MTLAAALSWYAIRLLLRQPRPGVKRRLRAGNGCQDAVTAALAPRSHGHTLRRELRAWRYADRDRLASWGPGPALDVAACFPARLCGVPRGWVSAGPRRRVRAVDPTRLRDERVALTISVVYRHHAHPQGPRVAWAVVGAHEPTSWLRPIDRLWRQLAPAVGRATTVPVLCDRGLWRQDLWESIVALGGHPVRRVATATTVRLPGAPGRIPARPLAGGPGGYGVGTGPGHRDQPLACTLIVRHDPQAEEPWIWVTHTPPDPTEPSLYALRHGIEPGFRGRKTVGWQWHQTRRRRPARAARHRRVRAIATLRALAYGTRCEDARRQGVRPGRWRRPPSGPNSLITSRRLRVLPQSLHRLRPRLGQGRLWALKGWWRPRPGPDRTAGLRGLSPPLA